MPLIPNALERLVLIGLNQQPGLLLDYFSTLGFRAAITGVRLGVFDALDEQPATAEELAHRLGTDPHATASLLEALRSLRYVRRHENRYANATAAARWLVRIRSPDLVEATRFLELVAFDMWADLERSVRSGQPVRPIYAWLEDDPERSAAFQAWTRWIASSLAPEIVHRVSLPAAARTLLDVGGGHGRYAAAFCLARPGLSAVVFDLPTALRSAAGLLEEPGLKGRIRLQAGDFLSDDLGADFDVALLLNIIHGLSEAENQQLISRVAAALGPGGLIVIAEQFAGRAAGPATDAIKRLLDLNYHLALGGRTYRFEEAAAWLLEAGLSSPKRINLRSAPGTSLAVSTLHA